MADERSVKEFRVSVNYGLVDVRRVSEPPRCIDTPDIGFGLQIWLLRRVNPWIYERSGNGTKFMRYFRFIPQNIEMNDDGWLSDPAVHMRKRWSWSIVEQMSYIKSIARLRRVVLDRIPTQLRYLGWWISERISVQSPNVPSSRKAGRKSPQCSFSRGFSIQVRGFAPLGRWCGRERWCQLWARREELILTVWRGFPVHEDEQNRGYFRSFQWHDVTVCCIEGFRRSGDGIIRRECAAFWIFICAPEWLWAAEIRLSFHGWSSAFWGFELQHKSNIEISRTFDIQSGTCIKIGTLSKPPPALCKLLIRHYKYRDSFTNHSDITFW
jgi:hypothetical protein